MIPYETLKQKLSGGALCHVYSKGRGGRVIFYSVEDCLVFYTLFSVQAKKYGITVVAFAIMANHYHFAAFCSQAEKLSAFVRETEKIYARNYNSWRGNSGSLFKRDFGRSPKTILKKATGCIAYVNNNPVAGKLVNNAMEYRWNLLAYKHSDYPFSEPLPSTSAMKRNMKYAKSLVDSSIKSGQFLNYVQLQTIVSKIDSSDWPSMLDYIIASYNFVNYEKAGSLFGNWERLVFAVDSVSGGEDDMKEDWEDFSYYRDMIRVCRSLHLDMKHFCPEKLTTSEISDISELLRVKIGAPKKHIKRFLHISR